MLDKLLVSLKAIYCHKDYNNEIFCLLEKHINSNKKKTGRKGMNLWTIFVFAQVRLCMNTSYDVLHNLANNHLSLRQIAGVEMDAGYKRIEFEYQNIYDNVSMLSDELITSNFIFSNISLKIGSSFSGFSINISTSFKAKS